MPWNTAADGLISRAVERRQHWHDYLTSDWNEKVFLLIMQNFVDTPAVLWYNMEGYIYIIKKINSVKLLLLLQLPRNPRMLLLLIQFISCSCCSCCCIGNNMGSNTFCGALLRWSDQTDGCKRLHLERKKGRVSPAACCTIISPQSVTASWFVCVWVLLRLH